jgi:hypothetical protein
MEGSISAIPRRLMVDEAEHSRAQRLLQEAEPQPDKHLAADDEDGI